MIGNSRHIRLDLKKCPVNGRKLKKGKNWGKTEKIINRKKCGKIQKKFGGKV